MSRPRGNRYLYNGLMIKQIADISIIIPTRDRPHHLYRLLDSLSRQTIKPREIIVVDNGRKKKSRDIIERFSESLPLRYLREPRAGVSVSRNKGVALSSASIVAFLDDDCVVESDWTDVIYNTFKERQDLYILQGRTDHISLAKSLYAEIFELEHAHWIESMLKKTPGYINMLNTQNLAIRREVLAGFKMPFDERLKTNEDTELYWKFKKRGIRIGFSKYMKAKHYLRNNFYSFLRSMYDYGFGKSQVKKIHFDFSDYYTDNISSKLSALRLMFNDIVAPYKKEYFKKILRQNRFMDAIAYYPFIILERCALFSGLFSGSRRGLGLRHDLGKPKEMVLFVTNRCNLRCQHCFYHDGLTETHTEIKASDIRKILKSLDHDLETVCIGGGEPFVCKELAAICKVLAQDVYLKQLYIVTNGFETGNIIETVKDVLTNVHYNIYIRVSIDGLCETHNRIRGNPQSFHNAMETLKALKALEPDYKNLNVDAQTIISQSNITDIEGLARFIEARLRVPHMFDIVRDKSMFYENEDFMKPSYGPFDRLQLLRPDQLKNLRKLTTAIYRRQARAGIMNKWQAKYQIRLFDISCRQAIKRRPVIECTAGDSIITVFPDYNVSICESTRTMGNLKEYDFDLRKMWEDVFGADVRKMRSKCYCTNPCYNSSSINNRQAHRRRKGLT